MASSLISPMLLFVLLVLVFSHMDQAFGSQMESHKLEGTNNVDPFMAQKLSFSLPGWVTKSINFFFPGTKIRSGRYISPSIKVPPRTNIPLRTKLPPYIKIRPTLSPREKKIFFKIARIVFKKVINGTLARDQKGEIENPLQHTKKPDDCQRNPTACTDPAFPLICLAYMVEFPKTMYCPPLEFVKYVKLCKGFYKKYPNRKCPPLNA